MSFTESGHWKKMLWSIIYLKALCSFHFIHSLSLLISVSLSAHVSFTLCLSAYTPHLFLSPFSLAVSLHLYLPPLRPSCGGVVPCARPQPKAGSPEGNAECWVRDRFRGRRLPPQWCSHVAQSLPGRAARASAHAQTLSCSPEDWRCLLTHTQIVILRLVQSKEKK